MSAENKNIEVHNNKGQQQFEYAADGEIAYLTYRYYKSKNIAFMHTLVPESLKGRGIASALAKAAFEFAAEQKKKVMVYCPFVGAYVKRHPEVKPQLDPEYHR